MKNENISLSVLCKQSAKQILYLRRYPEKITVTPEQVSGVKQQYQNTISDYREMCGVYRFKKNNIFFSWDEIEWKKDIGILKFIEHKSILGTPEKWYFENSVLQTAIYAAFTTQVQELRTARFFIKKGNPEFVINSYGNSRRFYLNFGGDTYKISLKRSAELRRFVFSKIESLVNFNTAEKFDAIWKRKEFTNLKQCFSFNKLKKNQNNETK